jgi:hypothetical protein
MNSQAPPSHLGSTYQLSYTLLASYKTMETHKHTHFPTNFQESCFQSSENLHTEIFLMKNLWNEVPSYDDAGLHCELLSPTCHTGELTPPLSLKELQTCLYFIISTSFVLLMYLVWWDTAESSVFVGDLYSKISWVTLTHEFTFSLTCFYFFFYQSSVYSQDIRPSDLTDVQCLWSDVSIFTPDQMSDVSMFRLKFLLHMYVSKYLN